MRMPRRPGSSKEETKASEVYVLGEEHPGFKNKIKYGCEEKEGAVEAEEAPAAE